MTRRAGGSGVAAAGEEDATVAAGPDSVVLGGGEGFGWHAAAVPVSAHANASTARAQLTRGGCGGLQVNGPTAARQ